MNYKIQRARMQQWLVVIIFLLFLLGLDILMPYTFYGQMVVVAFGIFVVFVGWPSTLLLGLAIGALVGMMPLVILQSPIATNFAVYAFLWLIFGLLQNIREWYRASKEAGL